MLCNIDLKIFRIKLIILHFGLYSIIYYFMKVMPKTKLCIVIWHFTTNMNKCQYGILEKHFIYPFPFADISRILSAFAFVEKAS